MNRLGFSTQGEADLAAMKLRKLFKCHTRVIQYKNGFWAVRTSFIKELLKD